MELTMSNGLCEMSVNEILLLDGGEWSWSSWRSCMGSRKLFSRTALERIIWIILSYI